MSKDELYSVSLLIPDENAILIVLSLNAQFTTFGHNKSPPQRAGQKLRVSDSVKDMSVSIKTF